MNFCLPKFAADSFKNALKNEGITPAKLEAMGDEGRNAFFQKHMSPEDAAKANALFEARMVAAGNREAKLLAKNTEKGRPELSDKQRVRLMKLQKDGMINWVKGLAGLKPEVRRDMLTKVERLGSFLDPKAHDDFLKDLVDQRLGLGVSETEMAQLTTLSKKVADAKKGLPERQKNLDDYLSGKLNRPKTDAEMKYGEALVNFNDYVNGVKMKAEKTTFADFKASPLNTIIKGAVNAAGVAKSTVAALDNSSIWNQGWKAMGTNPLIWARNAAKTYGDIVAQIGGKDVMKAVNMDLVSRPTYQLAKDSGLKIGTMEEAFPSALPEKIYGIGRFFKASQAAYTAFVHRTRMDIFDRNLQLAMKRGKDITDKKFVEDLAEITNSLTGRGSFGRYEGPIVDAANNLFFAPRYWKSNVDVLTAPLNTRLNPYARRIAAENLAKTATVTASILGAAKMMGADVEIDPRSSDFGSIKIGDTRYKIGGGMLGNITLASRILPTKNKGDWGFYTKSSTTGKVRELNDGSYTGRTVGDVVGTFAGNKFSPAFQLADDWWLSGVDFGGEKPTVAKSALKLITPFGVTTYQELAKDPEAEKIFSLILSGHGISVSNY